MNFPFQRRTVFIAAFLGGLTCAVGGMAAGVQARDAAGGATRAPALAAQDTEPADEDVRKQVQAALHADPYFYDQHVTVSIEKGNVVLRGFVASEWDLRNAIRIATTSAGGRRVIDNLSIKQGGLR